MVCPRAAKLVTADPMKGGRAAAPHRHRSLFVAHGTIRALPRLLSLCPPTSSRTDCQSMYLRGTCSTMSSSNA
jgi:hypothetical protein